MNRITDFLKSHPYGARFTIKESIEILCVGVDAGATNNSFWVGFSSMMGVALLIDNINREKGE